MKDKYWICSYCGEENQRCFWEYGEENRPCKKCGHRKVEAIKIILPDMNEYEKIEREVTMFILKFNIICAIIVLIMMILYDCFNVNNLIFGG